VALKSRRSGLFRPGRPRLPNQRAGGLGQSGRQRTRGPITTPPPDRYWLAGRNDEALVQLLAAPYCLAGKLLPAADAWPWHPGWMQWHWGNIGSAAGGLAGLLTVVFAVYSAVRYGPAWLREARARQQAQTDAAREQASLARQENEQIALDRRRALHGWSAHGIADFRVELVTSAEEMAQARDELLGGGPTGYVILRVAGSQSGNRGIRLRQLIESEGMLARVPTAGEREALEAGRAALDIP
jgi:hypothetical protein